MIVIRNTQRKVAVSLQDLERDTTAILHKLRYDDWGIFFMLVNEERMRHYNNVYRGKDQSTDVLSFPFHENAQPGKRIKVQFDDEKSLGDIMICPAYMVRNLEKYEVSFEQRLRILLVHSIYHLLGYDHINDDDYRKMQRQETAMLRHLNQLFPLS